MHLVEGRNEIFIVKFHLEISHEISRNFIPKFGEIYTAVKFHEILSILLAMKFHQLYFTL